MAQGVIVFVEIVRGKLSTGSREALALGRTLANTLSTTLGAVLLGGDASLGAEATYCGADTAYLLNEPLPHAYQPEIFADAAEQACLRLAPQMILLPHSPLGCDLAPRLSFRLGIACAVGCLEVSVGAKGGLLTRQVVGGKVMLEEERSFPVLATLRAKSFEPLARDESRLGEVKNLALATNSGNTRLRFVEHVEKAGGVREELAEATLIVSGGLGIGSETGFSQLGELATLLGGSLGASKAAVDRGWVEPDRQVGLTGVAVAPRLYLAVGISGASQHIAGCGKSRTLVAINKDAAANIFKYCRFGIVDEWEKVLPLLLAELKNAETAER